MSNHIYDYLISSIVEHWLDNPGILAKFIEFSNSKEESVLCLFPPTLYLSPSDFPKQILCILRQVQKEDYWNFEQIINTSLTRFFSFCKKRYLTTIEYNGKMPCWIAELEEQ